MRIRIDASNAAPPYEQVRSQLESGIRSGVLAAGSRIPTVRQLASDLRLAPGTIQSAYHALEEAGLIETRRGAGTTVASGHVANEQLVSAADAFASAARAVDLGIDQAVAILRAAWPVDAPSNNSLPD